MSCDLVRVERLDAVRTARATRRKISEFGTGFPYYVHKWTKQIRHYAITDLSLPETLFVNGSWPSWSGPIVSVGGTRAPTVETFCLVSNVVRELASAGVVIISGGVPGVDLAAHLAASDQQQGTTLAVLANPAENGLSGHEWSSGFVKAQILKQGAFVSEYSTTSEIGSDDFCERLLARDRIISGLCDVFLVFECNEDSATVDTARRALVQGKQVMCVDSLRNTNLRRS
jgi:DNA processing protein